ncbi:bifunctional DNA primase/polymerase [Longispora albida]|uniref:bifunctional DNA primase/polymerase n=1 Tax=Longispora albida TaxID=203523 RepID=UPI00035D8B8B|nr:bifunctional DNA primase/polymerase [Longispora albida]
MNNQNALLNAALTAAARGWAVFPLVPGSKRPAFPGHTKDDCTLSEYRCRSAGRHVGWEERATTDPGRVRRAWASVPYNIGIACGPSGLVVVDCDLPKELTGEGNPAQWPCEWAAEMCTCGADVLAVVAERAGHTWPSETFIVRTGGGGEHHYYRHPGGGPALRNTQGELGWLVDTRAHGGYVVAPGSIVDRRPYAIEWDTGPAPLPGWLAGLLEPAPLPPQEPVVVQLRPDRRGRYLQAAIDASVSAVVKSGDGQHNAALYRAAVSLGQLVAGGELTEAEVIYALSQAAARIRHGQGGEARRTIRSGLRAGAARPRSVAA